jgi:hypothetical protein
VFNATLVQHETRGLIIDQQSRELVAHDCGFDAPRALSASDLFLADEENFYVELVRKHYRVWKYIHSDRAELDIDAAPDIADP